MFTVHILIMSFITEKQKETFCFQYVNVTLENTLTLTRLSIVIIVTLSPATKSKFLQTLKRSQNVVKDPFPLDQR